MSEILNKTAKDEQMDSIQQRGILDPINAAKKFHLKRYAPSHDLASFIEHYWVIRWNLAGQQSYVSEVLPYPNINLTFNEDRAWITGVSTGKYSYLLEGAGVIVGVKFKPGTFYVFWPHSANGLTDKTLPANEVFPELDDAFRTKLLGYSSDGDIVVCLNSFLSSAVSLPSNNMVLAADIVEAIMKSEHLKTARAVAQHFQLSERSLQYLFQMYIGVGSKWVIMRFRLQEAAERIIKDERNWAVIAVELGYSDQAHFTRDFKKIIGKSPSEYLKSSRL